MMMKRRENIINTLKKLTRAGNVISDRLSKNVVPFRKIMRGRSLMTLWFKPPNTPSILINDTFRRKSVIPLTYIYIIIIIIVIYNNIKICTRVYVVYYFFNITFSSYLVERLLDLGRRRRELIEFNFDNVKTWKI